MSRAEFFADNHTAMEGPYFPGSRNDLDTLSD